MRRRAGGREEEEAQYFREGLLAIRCNTPVSGQCASRASHHGRISMILTVQTNIWGMRLLASESSASSRHGLQDRFDCVKLAWPTHVDLPPSLIRLPPSLFCLFSAPVGEDVPSGGRHPRGGVEEGVLHEVLAQWRIKPVGGFAAAARLMLRLSCPRCVPALLDRLLSARLHPSSGVSRIYERVFEFPVSSLQSRAENRTTNLCW